MSARTQEIYEFGRFRLLAADRLLLCDGRALPLTPKSLEILLLLVESHGHVVEKNALMERVWPDTHVQEDNITYNISVLRKLLGDGASGERYIETIPKRGYRFIVPVRIVTDGAELGTPDVAPPLPRPPSPVGTPEEIYSGTPASQTEDGEKLYNPLLGIRRNWWLGAWVTLGGVIAFVSAGSFFFVRHQEAHRLTPHDSVVLSDFANTTGETIFDETLKQALRTDLEQSPFLNVLSDQQADRELRFMDIEKGARLTPEMTREVCQRASGKAMLLGSIAKLGQHYAVGLDAVDCQTGNPLDNELVEADNREQVLGSLAAVATKMRGKLGEPLASIQEFNAPLEEVTTPSLEALRAYNLGRRADAEGDSNAAPFLQHAIELDPNFAMAYATLGIIYVNLGQPSLANTYIEKAFALRQRVSREERFRISGLYYLYDTGQLEEAGQTYQSYEREYPRAIIPRINLAVIYSYLGRYEEALEQTLEAVRLDPNGPIQYGDAIHLCAATNRLDEAMAAYQQGLDHHVVYPDLHFGLYAVAFLRGDAREMERQVASVTDKTESADIILSFESDTEAWSGRLSSARELSKRAIKLALQKNEKETAAGWEINEALRDVEFGNSGRARQEVAFALSQAPTRDVRAVSALILSRSGDNVKAQRLADQLVKENRLNTTLNKYWLPAVHAAIAINRGNPSGAIQFLEAATPYELGEPLPNVELGALMLPVYIRGQAFLSLHQGEPAAAEFQKILDHRRICVNCPTGALAHLGLARAYALEASSAGSGDGDAARVKARAAYQDFFKLWKDADPDIPLLIAAKAEFAKLR